MVEVTLHKKVLPKNRIILINAAVTKADPSLVIITIIDCMFIALMFGKIIDITMRYLVKFETVLITEEELHHNQADIMFNMTTTFVLLYKYNICKIK